MQIKSFPVGPLGVNCYICFDEEALEGIVVDPGGHAEVIIDYLKKQNLQIKYVINTHGHSDHIGANTSVCEATGAELCIHQADAEMLTDTKKNLSVFMGLHVISKPADKFLQAGDRVNFGKCSLLVLHTPGHSPGGICLVGEGVAFTGDSLFQESIGRTDFPGGSEAELIAAVKKNLLVLADETRVLPGHGPESSIGWEKQYNPYVNGSYRFF